MCKFFLFSALFFVFSFCSAIKGENSIVHDYITSGYFQLIHQADIAYLEGNYDLAFVLLQEAERRMPLINQYVRREIELYAWLLIKNGQYDRAVYYMEHLAVTYGQYPLAVTRRFYDNPDIKSRFVENNPDFFDVTFPALMAKSEDFYTPERLALIQILNEMSYNDRRVRTGSVNFFEMREVDNANRIKMLQIIEKHGFPNERLFGSRDPSLLRIEVMFLHFLECKEIEEILRQAVRVGDASPSLYGWFIDRNVLFATGKFTFGAAMNITDEQIYDVENVDKRRLAIGMPTREQERRRRELIAKRR